MTLQPNFLPVGSVVYQVIENFEPCTPKPIVFSESNWYRIGECVEYLDWFQPIALTPEILTEWCDAKHDKDFPREYRIGNRLFLFRDGKCFDYGSNTQLDYLHELQLLFLGMKTVLPITIK